MPAVQRSQDLLHAALLGTSVCSCVGANGSSSCLLSQIRQVSDQADASTTVQSSGTTCLPRATCWVAMKSSSVCSELRISCRSWLRSSGYSRSHEQTASLCSRGWKSFQGFLLHRHSCSSHSANTTAKLTKHWVYYFCCYGSQASFWHSCVQLMVENLWSLLWLGQYPLHKGSSRHADGECRTDVSASHTNISVLVLHGDNILLASQCDYPQQSYALLQGSPTFYACCVLPQSQSSCLLTEFSKLQHVQMCNLHPVHLPLSLF